MSLAVAPFALPGERKAALAIVVRIEEPAPKQAAQISEELVIRAAAYAPTGDRSAYVNRVFPVSIKASGRGGMLRFDLPLRLDLPPGRYHLRVSAKRKRARATSTSLGAVKAASIPMWTCPTSRRKRWPCPASS